MAIQTLNMMIKKHEDAMFRRDLKELAIYVNNMSVLENGPTVIPFTLALMEKRRSQTFMGRLRRMSLSHSRAG